jgi:hypothetical protein
VALSFLATCNAARLPDHDEIFSRITTPYDVDAIESLLEKHNLGDSYPFLINNLRRGFPMGDFPPLLETVIFPNNDSAVTHAPFVADHLAEEVRALRMSGPFSQREVETILKGPFQCSPIIIASQSQAPGEPDKLRLCRHLSKSNKAHPSTNDWIDKEKFPTKFGSAAAVAELVSFSFPYLFFFRPELARAATAGAASTTLVPPCPLATPPPLGDATATLAPPPPLGDATAPRRRHRPLATLPLPY